MEATPIAIAVVCHQGRCLVGLRGADQALGGLAEFPGGKIEPGESPTEAAIRECLEEAGLAVRVVRSLEEKTHVYEHGTLRLHFLLCEPCDADQPPTAPFGWVPLCELTRLEFPAANASVIAKIAADG